MKTKIIFRILLGISAIFLAYLCINSVLTPIRFENKRAAREQLVVKRLEHLRTAENEFKLVNGYFTNNLDSLILFLQNYPKKEVVKEGSLTDRQLESGLTETKAVKILEKAKNAAKKKLNTDNDSILYAYIWNNDAEVKQNGLSGFRRDTVYKNMIETLYKGEYNADDIQQIIYIPYNQQKQRFEVEVNNSYSTSQGIRIPIMEARAPFNSYLMDLDKQERVNLIDKEEKLEHYAGLKFGSLETPNNNAGNWE